MSDHADQMNALLRRAAGRGRFTVTEAEQSPASVAMNAILRGEQPPAHTPEEAEPEPVWHNADASAGLGQSLPRRQPTMDDVLRGDHRAGRRERQSEAEQARLEREQSREHRSW